MFERLMLRGAALAEALGGEAPAGVEASESEDGVVLSGRGLGRRFALEAGLRWLLAGRGR